MLDNLHAICHLNGALRYDGRSEEMMPMPQTCRVQRVIISAVAA